jgi:hypothetical protein
MFNFIFCIFFQINIEQSIPPKSNILQVIPQGYSILSNQETNITIHKIAVSLLGRKLWTITLFSIGDKKYLARVEPHYHPFPPAGTTLEEQSKYPKPWGWHKGITVYRHF